MRINAKRKIKPGTRFVCVKMSELNKVVSHGEEREKMSLILEWGKVAEPKPSMYQVQRNIMECYVNRHDKPKGFLEIHEVPKSLEEIIYVASYLLKKLSFRI